MPQYNYLIWMDMEMSGLEPSTDTILEISTVVTDLDLNLVEKGPCLAVFQDNQVLDAMDDWNQKHHSASGLIQRVKDSKIDTESAEDLTLDFIKRFGGKRQMPLCGNSIHQDRRFLRKYMKNLDDYLHYRIIDVSSVKELKRCWYPSLPAFEKKNKHSAFDDVIESIEELKYYRENFFNLALHAEPSKV